MMAVLPMQGISSNNDGTYIVHGPPHSLYAGFAMPAMFGAFAAEVWWLPISSHDSGGPWDYTFASLALPYLFLSGFLHLTWAGIVLGRQKSDYSICWKCTQPSLLSPLQSLIERPLF